MQKKIGRGCVIIVPEVPVGRRNVVHKWMCEIHATVGKTFEDQSRAFECIAFRAATLGLPNLWRGLEISNPVRG